MANRNGTFIIIILFFIWILPLGVFIQPEKEKQLCDGRRAICLCTHRMAQPAADQGKMILQIPSSSVEKERTPSTSHNFLPFKPQQNPEENISDRYTDNRIFYSIIVLRPIEHVPKFDFS